MITRKNKKNVLTIFSPALLREKLPAGPGVFPTADLSSSNHWRSKQGRDSGFCEDSADFALLEIKVKNLERSFSYYFF